MELKNFYLHAVNVGETFSCQDTVAKMNQIFDSNAILSRRLTSDTNLQKGGWNGLDYISICDPTLYDAPTYNNSKFYEGYNAFNSFIKQSVSLVLNRENISAEKPILMPPAIFDWESLQEMRYLGNHGEKRYSDFPDELQVKDKINLANLVAFMIPVSHVIGNQTDFGQQKQSVQNLIDAMRKCQQRYQYIVPIYSLETTNLLENDEDIKSELLGRK